MNIIVNNVITCINTPNNIKDKIASELTIANPAYAKAQMLNFSTWNIPKTIKFFDTDNKNLILPRGYGRRLLQLLKDNYIQYTMDTSGILELPTISFNSNITLRDYQQPIPNIIVKNKNGCIILPCGGGKTSSAIHTISVIAQPAIWLTHTIDLLNQSLECAKRGLGLTEGQYGIINGKTNSIGTHITFATIQTLANRDLTDIVNKFGTIVIDEVHKTFMNEKSAAQFESVIKQFPGKYRIGLTASEHRSDGLSDSMYHLIGPKLYFVSQAMLQAKGNVTTPTIHFINTDFIFDKEPGKMIEFSKMIKAMSNDYKRNNLLIKTICDTMTTNDYALVLGNSVDHLDFLKSQLISKSNGLTADFIHGKSKKATRISVLDDMRNRKTNVLFATYQLAKEGLDIPCLNRLYLATPLRDKTVIQQSVGRIMRPAEGKTDAIVYDIIDNNISTCHFQARNRIDEVYNMLKCKIINKPC